MTNRDYSVFAIGKFFIDIYKKEFHKEKIAPIKLQKLTYISYGWALSRNIKLFDNLIEAWRYGPVIPKLYYTYKYERETIDSMDIEPFKEPDMNPFLSMIFNKYGYLNSNKLVAITHGKGTPWDQVYDGSFDKEIPDKIIMRYYKKILN